jgi:hypothetical protein
MIFARGWKFWWWGIAISIVVSTALIIRGEKPNLSKNLGLFAGILAVLALLFVVISVIYMF